MSNARHLSGYAILHQPINQSWFEQRAKNNGAAHKAQPSAKA